MARKISARKASWQGGKWIRPERRLGLYLRDGLACVWCLKGIEDGIQLSLDHLVPHCDGGNNLNENLCTSCLSCNSSRGSRSIEEFAAAVALYVNHGVTPEEILVRISSAVARPVNILEAKELLARRGGIAASVQGER